MSEQAVILYNIGTNYYIGDISDKPIVLNMGFKIKGTEKFYSYIIDQVDRLSRINDVNCHATRIFIYQWEYKDADFVRFCYFDTKEQAQEFVDKVTNLLLTINQQFKS